MTRLSAYAFACGLALAAAATAQTAVEDYRPDDRRAGDILIRDRSSVPECPNQGPQIIPPCEAGTELVLFDAPVLDEDGLFLICTKKVPFCIPEGLGPQGFQPGGGLVGIRAFVARARREGRDLPATLVALAEDGDGPLEDTTITCNDDTQICTCTSSEDGDCGPKLAAICDSETSWSDGGVGEDCPSTTDEE